VKNVVVEVEIDRPAPEVFAFLDEVENNPSWLAGMTSCTWTSPPPVDVGSSYDQVAHFLGRDIITKFVVTKHDPPWLVTITSAAGSSFPLTVTREVEPIDERRCRVIETIESDPSGFYKIAAPLLALMVRSRVARDYRRLKHTLESATTP